MEDSPNWIREDDYVSDEFDQYQDTELWPGKESKIEGIRESLWERVRIIEEKYHEGHYEKLGNSKEFD